MKSKLILLLLLSSLVSSQAQTVIFSENMGNPTGTTAIASNTFQNNGVLSYSNVFINTPTDVRTTNASSNYSSASGAGNVFFSSSSGSYGFSIEGINASNFTSLSLQFGYRKESASALPTFSLEYWNGNSWVAINETLFSQLPTASATWYLSNSIPIPTGAQINNLKLRFIKTGSVAIRIDDVKLTGTIIVPTVTNTTITNVSSNSATFAGNVAATGGISITATGSVYAITSTNAAPTIGGTGVTILSTSSPNNGTGTFSNNSGAVLLPNVQYSYNAYATNSASGTGYGTVANFYTLAAIPSAPTVGSPTGSSLNITIANDSNPSLTTYAIFEINTAKYVQADGTLGVSPIYQTASTWGTKTLTGLTPSTTYTFQVTAKNGNGDTTTGTTTSDGTTLAQASITPSGTLSALSTVYGSVSSALSFSISGANLTDNIVVTPPLGFEVSQTNGGNTGYASSQILNPSNGSIPLTTLYIRLAATTAFGTYSGNITFSSANDVLTVNLATVPSSVTKLNATISGITALNKVCDGSTIATLSGTPTLNGILSSDTNTVTLNTGAVTANFADAIVGSAKAVTVSGYALSGSASANYNLIQPSGLTANITANTSSDVVFNSGSTTSDNTKINYKIYQGTTLTSTQSGVNGSLGVMGFYLRDGGGLNDADNLSTELSSITFNVTNPNNILRMARLFIGNSVRGIPVTVSEPINGISTIVFTDLTNIVAADNNQLAVNLRVTFRNTVIDKQQLQFTVSSVTANTAGSQFAAPNGGGASSSIAGDINRIEVKASELNFVVQPLPESFVETNMNPSPSVEAIDDFGNRDLDATVSITSSGILNSSPQTASTTSGLATFNSINHTTPSSELRLTATAAEIQNPATSNTFTINPLILPTFEPVAPVYYGSTLMPLPTTSTNGITGTWSPALNNTATTTYTFSPTAGQNASIATLTITVNPLVTITLASGIGTNISFSCINTTITNISYTTTGATNATFSGLPTGISGDFSSNIITISGTPTVLGTFPYTITLTGNSGSVTATGKIYVSLGSTIVLNSGIGTNNQSLDVNTALSPIAFEVNGAGIETTGLPNGVTWALSQNIVTVSGTPTSAGIYPYRITLKNNCGEVSSTGLIKVNSIENTATASNITPAIVNIAPTGTSSQVGITEGQLSVSLSGGANYSIPIAVPPGLNGVVPQIGLSYNSQSGNGLAGYGWNISGISTITRIPSTKFHDNIIDAVDFDSLDRFAFDGQRLIVKNGNNDIYGDSGTVYETENFSNVQITSYGVHPSGSNYGPAYFTVQYPDGSVAQYGNSSDSRSLTDYAITYWENPQGIRINYEYIDTNNILTISKIKYGLTASQGSGINEINFEYTARQRPEQAYIRNHSFLRNTILKAIHVSGNGVGFRNYYLDHDITSLGYERLTSITEKTGNNGLSYNPTVFSYDTTNNTDLFKMHTPATLDLTYIDYTNTSSIQGDFDGDGKTDIILYPTTGTNSKAKYYVYTDIKDNQLNFSDEHPVGAFEEMFPVSWLSWSNKLMPMQAWSVVKKNDLDYTFTVYSHGISSPILYQYEKVATFPTVNIGTGCTNCSAGHANKMFPKKILSGDFNGDGLTDVIAIDKSLQSSICTEQNPHTLHCGSTNTTITSKKVYFVDLKRDNTTNYLSYIGDLASDLSDTSKIEVADVNGDGKSDFLIFETGEVKAYSMNSSNQLEPLFSKQDAGILLDKPLLMGDYNGDGKMDFVIPQANNSDNWNFYFSTGTTFNVINTGIGFPYNLSKYGYFGIKPNTTAYSLGEVSYIPTDMNGDGKTDIIYQENYTIETNSSLPQGTPQVTRFFLLENKSSSSNSIYFDHTFVPSQYVGVNRYPIPIFTNHNKINLNLEYSLISGNKIQIFNSAKDSRIDVLLKNITTGNGVTESITYKPLVKSVCGYNCNYVYSDSGYTEDYPNTDILVAQTFNVVSLLEKQSASDYKKQLFSYYGAVSNTEGLGFLGFRATMRTNWHDANETNLISTVTKNDVNLRGAPVDSYSVLGFYPPQNVTPTTNFISKSNTVYNTDNSTGTVEPHLQSNKVFKLKNTKTLQFNGLDNTNSETKTDYDIYNNPLIATTTLKNGTTIEQTTTTTVTYDNQPTGTTYYIGRPKTKNQSIATTDDTSQSEELYTYTNHLLTKIMKNNTNSGITTPYMIEENDYDQFGNIIQKVIYSSSASPRITNYEYNPSAPFFARFLTKSKDIEGLSTIFEYDYSNGQLLSETNPYGLITSYEYDNWFKKIKTTDYLGKNSTYQYTRNSEKTLITTTGDDGSASMKLFDDLGRKITSGVKDINNNFSYTSYLYDIYDRNYKVSEPYFGSAASQWNETKYDEYGRIIKNNLSTGKTVNITYTGLTTVIDDGLKTKSSTKNAIGNVVSITDNPGGTIYHTYFANGNLHTTTFENAVTTVEQDGWGRKSKLIDPSAGTYRYEYNNFGEIKKEIIENKGIITYDINNVGKVNYKTIIGLNGDTTNSKTTYTYDPTTKLLTGTRFDDFTAGFTTMYTYGYDSNKRLNFKDESGTNAYFKQETQYDDFGRPYRELYSAVNTSDGKRSDKWIKNTYKNGYNWQILDDATSTVLRQINTENARGQLLTANSGLYTQETNGYDQYGFPTSSTYLNNSGPNANSPILKVFTSFNGRRGNLNSRSIAMNGLSINDTFTYDTQDRLTSYPNETGALVNQSYDDKGKITANNIGTYAYTIENKPYQVSTITPEKPSAVYDYYATREQNVIYNVFKSPVTITEQGQENIDFEYNAFNSRATMYYGGLQTEKNLRPLIKMYSADGTMEIKRNLTNPSSPSVEFITYIGGDGYTAPLVLKSDGTTQKYLYLHRDYQGSILAISDEAGQVLEKRFYDAWGSLIKYWNISGVTTVPTTEGTMLLDRGYTGHEHLLGVGLINMNARLYDPKLHRFLQPDNYVQDPSNTQNYNRYGYCYNNPLKYTDVTGEWFGLDDLVVAAASFVIGYVGSGLSTGNWGWSSVKAGLICAVTGWLAYNTAGASTGITAGSGSLNAAMGNFIINQAASVAMSYFIPPIGIKVGDWGFSISPSIAFGNASGVGVSLSVTYSSGDFSFSGGIGIMSNSNYNGFGKNGLEIRKSILMAYDDGKTGFSLGSNIWSGDFAQTTGVVGLHFGDFRAMYENDGSIGPGGDGGDKYRTAALNLSVGEFTAGFNLFTGNRDYENEGNLQGGHRGSPESDKYGRRMPNGYALETGTKYRLGAMTIGYGNYRVGVNSEHIRHAIQDQAIHNLRIPGIIDKRQRGFENQSWDWKGYSQYRTSNIFTSW